MSAIIRQYSSTLYESKLIKVRNEGEPPADFVDAYYVSDMEPELAQTAGEDVVAFTATPWFYHTVGRDSMNHAGDSSYWAVGAFRITRMDRLIWIAFNQHLAKNGLYYYTTIFGPNEGAVQQAAHIHTLLQGI